MSTAMQFSVAAMAGDPQRPNEDFAGVFGTCAVLLDGSGAPGDMPTGCIHGVPWFVRQLGTRCLAGMATAENDHPLDGILASAIAEVVSLHQNTCDLEAPGTPSSVIIMARSGPKTLDYLVLGDSTLVVEDTDGGLEVVSDRRMESVAVEEFRKVLALRTGTPEHQAARIAFVRRQQPLRNQPDGYPIASTDPEAAAQALTGSIPAAHVSRTVMMSDGVSRFTEFGIGTWNDLLSILATGGPASLFHRIRTAEDSDPVGARWPRAKRHDDVSVVYWESSHNEPALPIRR